MLIYDVNIIAIIRIQKLDKFILAIRISRSRLNKLVRRAIVKLDRPTAFAQGAFIVIKLTVLICINKQLAINLTVSKTNRNITCAIPTREGVAITVRQLLIINRPPSIRRTIRHAINIYDTHRIAKIIAAERSRRIRNWNIARNNLHAVHIFPIGRRPAARFICKLICVTLEFRTVIRRRNASAIINLENIFVWIVEWASQCCREFKILTIIVQAAPVLANLWHWHIDHRWARHLNARVVYNLHVHIERRNIRSTNCNWVCALRPFRPCARITMLCEVIDRNRLRTAHLIIICTVIMHQCTRNAILQPIRIVRVLMR